MARSYSTAAALIALARVKSGLSQRRLAEQAGVPTTMISAYERGLRQPTLPTLERLLSAAGFELRLHLATGDDHDHVLEKLERRRTSSERRRRDQQIEAWRRARPATG
jgi:transcriptional regulator with XRE-family HTH domain